MKHTQTIRTSWGSRIGSSIKGIFFGFLLLILAFPLIFWNEGKAVKRAKALNEGAGMVVTIEPTQIDAANNSRLVHLSGFAATDAVLKDSQLGIGINALRLSRSVEMYQWRERESRTEEKNLGGSTDTKITYSYEQEWSNRLIRSADFKVPAGHQNPTSMAYEDNAWVAERAELGAFELSRPLLAQLGGLRSLAVTPDMLNENLREQFQFVDDLLYRGKNPEAPAIGDLRIRYSVLEPQTVSLVARQINNGFEPYTTTNGEEILFVRTGAHSADALFTAAHEANVLRTWILRAASVAMMFIGLGMIFKPLSVLADVVPLFGNIVGMGTTLVAFLLALILASVTIAIAWIVFRPLLGLALLALAGLGVYLLARRRSQLKAASPSMADNPVA